jgi:hypothetical protein
MHVGGDGVAKAVARVVYSPVDLVRLERTARPLRKYRLASLTSYTDGWEIWNLAMSFDSVVFLRDSEPGHLPAN